MLSKEKDGRRRELVAVPNGMNRSPSRGEMAELENGYCQYLIPQTLKRCQMRVSGAKKYCCHHTLEKRIVYAIRYRFKAIPRVWKLIASVLTILGFLLTLWSIRSGATRDKQEEILKHQQAFASLFGEMTLSDVEEDLNREFPMGYTLIIIGKKMIIPYVTRQPAWLKVSWGDIVVDEITDDYILLGVRSISEGRMHIDCEGWRFICERTPGARVRDPKYPIFGTLGIEHREGLFCLSAKLVKDSKDLVAVAFVLECAPK
jgi:hypothetical protein